jgi:hypothetical protein
MLEGLPQTAFHLPAALKFQKRNRDNRACRFVRTGWHCRRTLVMFAQRGFVRRLIYLG